MFGIPILPETASSGAAALNVLFWGLMALALGFAVPICAMIVFFSVKYRHGHQADRKHPPRTSRLLEIGWIVFPLVIGTGFFAWAAVLYVQNSRPPADATEIYVVGKQWMWKVQHQNGRREINALHVPLGQPIKLIMTSQDVIHDFFVPAFRVKQDVLPGRYTTEWFTPTKEGTFHLFCSEYCGTYHSKMGGWVTVMKPRDYATWLNSGGAQPEMAKKGAQLFTQLGCAGCHGPNSNVRAPMLDGIYGSPVAIQTPGSGQQVVTADEKYLRDSILLPASQIAAGYKPIMPSYAGRVSEDDLLQIISFIKSLKANSLSEHSGAASSSIEGDAAAANYQRSWASKGTAGKR